MTDTSTTTIEPDVDAWAHDPAVGEALAAQQAATTEAADLEQRVVAGDTAVSLDDLEAAEKRSRLAGLRARGAAKQAQQKADRERLDRIASYRDLIRRHFGRHDGDVIEAFDEAVAALRPLVEAVEAHNGALTEIVDDLLAIDSLPADLNPNRAAGSIHLPDVDVFVQPIDLAVLLAEAAWRAASAAGSDAADGLEPSAHVGRDHHTSAHLGIATDPEGRARPHGPSDVLRRTARIVAEAAR